MRLNKRGKRVRSVLILIALTLAIQFYTTHHRVYGKCHQASEGWTCTLLRWEHN